MFQSTPLTTTSSQSPLRVTFDPAPILHEQSYTAPRVTYDPETGVLTYKQDPALAGQPVQFVLPTTTQGYSVRVEIESSGLVVAQGAELVLPPLMMNEQYSAEISFTATSTTDGTKPRRPKFKTDIRVRPTGGG